MSGEGLTWVMVTETPSRSGSRISLLRKISARAWRNTSPTRSWRWDGPMSRRSLRERVPPRGVRLRDISNSIATPACAGIQELNLAYFKVLKGALNGFDFETLDYVALLHILIVREGHAAFLAILNFAHFVLEALEGGKLAFMDHDIVADQAHPGAAPHHALGDAAAGDLANLGDGEDFQDFGIAQELLARFGRQQARQRRLHIIHHIVDDVVIANIDAVALGALARLIVGADIEADYRRARGMGEDDIAFGDAADARLQDLRPHFVGAQLGQSALDGFRRALHISLEHQRQQPLLSRFPGLEKLIQRLTGG